MDDTAPPHNDDLAVARLRFRDALLKLRETRKDVGDVEAAAARFCEILRRTGHSPEAALIDAKRVIEGAIDGDNKPIAERAILSCIQHFYAS
ncbi:MAG: hypothetical protein ABIT20_14855 [Gemmatimonadaceae bacterium]